MSTPYWRPLEVEVEFNTEVVTMPTPYWSHVAFSMALASLQLLY
jgi:hypothetical protein